MSNLKAFCLYIWYCYLHPSAIQNWVLAKYYEYLGPMFRTAQQLANARMKGNTLTAMEREIAKRQYHCKHKKGGMFWGLNENTPGTEISRALDNGNGSQYSVIKHKMINGDIWVDCLRCGKKWKPPMRADYRNDQEFYRALDDYERAVDFDTNNTMSTSAQCRFTLDGSDLAGQEYYRKNVASS